MNKSPQMEQLLEQVSAVFQGSQYPEFALQRVQEIIKNSRASRDEKNYMARMAKEYAKAFAEEREKFKNMTPEQRRAKQIQEQQEQQRIDEMQRRRLEAARKYRKA